MTSRPLTPRQITVLDRLIAVGAERPVADPGLAGRVQERLVEGTRGALDRWTERSLYVTKAQVLTALRCEGQLVAQAAAPRGPLSGVMVMGTLSHLAIQLSYTHQGRPVDEYVRQAIIAGRRGDTSLDEWWSAADPAEQSDLMVQIASRVTNFLDEFPPLQEAWSPRFEEPMSVKAGKLTLSCRPDLVIGRPRGDFRQTLLLVDFKSGDVKDEHLMEARFYGLVATMRYGVPPWRSTVYSLSSGEYTEPDITEAVLLETADVVAGAITGIVDALAEVRPPVLTAGTYCRFCPAKDSCPAAAEALLALPGAPRQTTAA
jgi:hypothetical protein